MNFFGAAMLFVVGLLFVFGVYSLAAGFDDGDVAPLALDWGTAIRGVFFFGMAIVLPFVMFMGLRR